MILGIDASNIRAGGGLTHLVELLRTADPIANGFSKVIVWSGLTTLSRIEDRPWLLKIHESILDRRLPYRVFWQRFKLSKLARKTNCALLFVPGGSYAGDFRPMVTMSQNLLPFELRELLRFGVSSTTLRLLVLRETQSRSFRTASGIIFLTRHAQEAVCKVTGPLSGLTTIIPHGIDERFFNLPREQKTIDYYSQDKTFRLLYVSIISAYKHQCKVAEAVAMLKAEGFPIVLDLLGPGEPPFLQRLKRTLDCIDPSGKFIRYLGAIPRNELHTSYASSEVCIFASTCENMPIILLESMASGLPIACSDRGPMPEMLGDAGEYFDPEDPFSIARAIRKLIESPELRKQKAHDAFQRARQYSWARCANETFGFLAQVVAEQGNRQGSAI